jgi:hypothetical protein
MKQEIGGAPGMYGEEERYIQDFNGKTCGKVATWKTQA